MAPKLFRYTATDDFLQGFIDATKGLDFKGLESEEAIFSKAGISFIAPELRETAEIIEKARIGALPQLVKPEDIKGVIHSHTTYSDGIHSLAEMVAAAREKGYEYIGITDHSKSAFYANGLKPDRVLQQMAEIDAMEYSAGRL